MKKIFVLVATFYTASAAVAQDPAALSLEQAAIVYDQCLARAAVQASRTDAADTAIFGLAKAQCDGARRSLAVGSSAQEKSRIFEAIDADKQASFPELTRKVRERRKTFEAKLGSPK